MIILSAQGNRSAASSDLERFTQGFAQTAAAANGPVPALAQGITLTFSNVAAGETVYYNGFSLANLATLTGTGGILLSTGTLSAPNGTLTFFEESFIDVKFDGVSASVEFTISRTGDFSVYHYAIGSTGSGAWEVLPASSGVACTGGAKLCAGIVDNGAGTSTVTILSEGAGSPFVVGPTLSAPVVARRSGGGCLAVGVEDSDLNPLDGILNFLMMLLPIGVLLMRRLR